MRKSFSKTLALAALFAAAMALAACDNGPAPVPTPTPTPAITAQAPPTTTPVALQKVTIALGYLPDVQFAPFYLALNNGYYKELGLDVTLQNGIAPELIKELGSGTG